MVSIFSQAQCMGVPGKTGDPPTDRSQKTRDRVCRICDLDGGNVRRLTSDPGMEIGLRIPVEEAKR